LAISSLHWIGSFQDERVQFLSENPLEEVWAHISRFGTSFVERHFKPDNDIPWAEYLKYAQVRVRQAHEFRLAARMSSLLTSPLPLYYAFLNLTRAFLAVGPEVMPRTGHGLRFEPGEQLLDSKALIVTGTFSDYLDTQKIPWEHGQTISLGQALSCILELAEDYRALIAEAGYAQAVLVRASMSGPVRLQFNNYPRSLAEHWRDDFPELADSCAHEEGACLVVNDAHLGDKYEAVAQYVKARLMPGLILQNHPTWYAIRRDSKIMRLPRAGYYHVAAFILGSAVRYEPELILPASHSDSEVGLLLRRFVACAERYFPQLKLSELYKTEVYFSGGSW
jgi:YaaC-like Protein